MAKTAYPFCQELVDQWFSQKIDYHHEHEFKVMNSSRIDVDFLYDKLSAISPCRDDLLFLQTTQLNGENIVTEGLEFSNFKRNGHFAIDGITFCEIIHQLHLKIVSKPVVLIYKVEKESFFNGTNTVDLDASLDQWREVMNYNRYPIYSVPISARSRIHTIRTSSCIIGSTPKFFNGSCIQSKHRCYCFHKNDIIQKLTTKIFAAIFCNW